MTQPGAYPHAYNVPDSREPNRPSDGASNGHASGSSGSRHVPSDTSRPWNKPSASWACRRPSSRKWSGGSRPKANC